MPIEDQPQVPFDEQAALEHLERLKHDLEESRRRRKDASEAFDTFVSSFRKDPAENAAAAAGHTEPRLTPARFERPDPFPIQPTTRRKPVPIGLVAGGVLAIAAGLVVTRVWRGSPPEASNSPAAVQTPAAREPLSGATGSAAAPAAPATATATGSELIALRDVWVRATVDGARIVERELEAGARVPLRGRTIVIRAGNAGAIRIVIDGQDRGTLGAEGVVATRTFTASAGR